MYLQKFIIQIVLIAFTGAISAVDNISQSVFGVGDPYQKNLGDFKGYNLEWIYHRNETDFYLIKNQASDDRAARSRFKYTQVEGGNEKERIIQIHLTSDYLEINPDGVLDVSEEGGNTCFVPVPISPDNDDFYLHTCIEDLPLVTPITHPPFQFYLKTRYPDEPPAIFRLAPYILNVSEIYDGKRDNVLKTLELIRDMDPLLRDSAYAELTLLMFNAGHLIGKDVFQLAKYVLDDTGTDSLAFQSLPQVVQAITAGGRVRLIYSHLGTQNMTMKSYRTYTISPGYYLPYTFSSTTDGARWAITYGINEQLGHESNATQLTAIVTNAKNYQFQLCLKPDHETIELRTDRLNSGVYNSLKSRQYSSGPNGYNFVNDGYIANTTFIVVPYIFNGTEMYAGLRENINITADFIQNNLTDVDVDKALAYEQLLSEMTAKRHKEGKEIFVVGQYILEDIGNSSNIFQLLPYGVKEILKGGRVRVKLIKSGEYPLKYTWASDQHENIHAYSFEYSRTNGRRFAITYSNDFQWSVPTTGGLSRNLTEIRTLEKEYLFHMHLESGLHEIQIRCWSESEDSKLYYSIRTDEQRPEFHFMCYGSNSDSAGDLFRVSSI